MIAWLFSSRACLSGISEGRWWEGRNADHEIDGCMSERDVNSAFGWAMGKDLLKVESINLL